MLISFVCLSTIVLHGQSVGNNEKSMKKFDYRRVLRTLIGANDIESFSPSAVEDKMESFGTRMFKRILKAVQVG